MLVGTATVTTQDLNGSHDTTKSGDLLLATTGDRYLATSGYFFMATDTAHATHDPPVARSVCGSVSEKPVAGHPYPVRSCTTGSAPTRPRLPSGFTSPSATVAARNEASVAFSRTNPQQRL